MDLYDDEQRVYDNAIIHAKAVREGANHSIAEYESLAEEYRKLLKHLRRVTKLSDRTTVDLHVSNLDLEDKAHLDALTGIYNRRYMEENLKRIMATLARSGGLLSVLMLDVDSFKKYNDTYGHSMGDVCLKTVAKTIKNCVMRSDDFSARYGGEEFIVVLPNTDENGARNMAERILENIRLCNIPHEKNEAAECVTISIGATTGCVRCVHNSGIYVDLADKALYQSKQNGKNRYTFINFEENVQ